eukprot:CAMPEP_0117444048 /NCGR_PEP_ID=MMETSP0759-20121206/5028_1 /TAXON_ID=63605 /ORGANISM="Percolomonas cosmopolitus, Strain WS" /LENGTH=204 /DNA_ID=CAMNT_0005236079 /DNA_START=86 /DNA_END=700 /DNA_ORIENTATION=+
MGCINSKDSDTFNEELTDAGIDPEEEERMNEEDDEDDGEEPFDVFEDDDADQQAGTMKSEELKSSIGAEAQVTTGGESDLEMQDMDSKDLTFTTTKPQSLNTSQEGSDSSPQQNEGSDQSADKEENSKDESDSDDKKGSEKDQTSDPSGGEIPADQAKRSIEVQEAWSDEKQDDSEFTDISRTREEEGEKVEDLTEEKSSHEDV